MLKKIILLLVLGASTLMGAQTTAVTLNATDGDGQAWANGTWSVSLVPVPGSPGGPYYVKGTTTPVPNQLQNGNLDGTGSASLTVTPNTSISPNKSAWRFTVCSSTNPTVCYVSLQNVTGPSYAANLVPDPIRIQLASPVYSYALYQDVEAVGPINGSLYWNLTSGVFRQYSNGAWTTLAGGGGSGSLIGFQSVDGTTNPNIQAAITAAGTTQGVYIPPNYAGTDSFTNSNNRPISDNRRIGDVRGGRLSVLDFGADPTAGYYWNTSMTSGTSTVNFAYYAGLNKSGGTLSFNSAKVGQRFCVSGAGVAGADLCGHVLTNNNAYPATITLDVTASTTVSGRGAYWGNDSTTAFQAAINACSSPLGYSILGGCEIDVPAGQYLTSSTVNYSTVSELGTGRQTINCAGRNSTKIIWTGADQGIMFHGSTSPVPIGMQGCQLTSADYTSSGAYSGGRRAAIGLQIDGGTQHRIIDNRFSDLYIGIKMSDSWLNLIDNNYFYGQYFASIYYPSGANGGFGPVNATTISNNEFGFYHLRGFFNESNGSGGSNGNFNFANDYEGTATDTIADVDDVSNWDTFGPNRFETGGSTVVGYSSLILRGAFKNVYMTFCGGIQILGTDNTISCSSAVSPSTPVTDGGFNVWMGQITRSAGVATSSTIVGSNRQGVMIDANGKADLGTGNGLTGTHPGPWLKLNGKDFRTHTAQETNPNFPTCSSTNETFNVRDIVWNDYAAGVGFGVYDQVYAWMCVNNSGCGCNPPVASDWKELGELRTKMTREGTAAPVSGNWNVGDFIRNTNTAGTNPVYGWLCTVAGTPGTWVALTAIDPTNPPAWGATTQQSVRATTLQANTTLTVGTNATISGNATGATYTATASTQTPNLIAGGPAAWFKADDGTSCTVDGTLTTTWNDSAAIPHNATNNGTTQRPTCKLSIVNGKPVFRFAGSHMFATASFTLNQPETVFIVYQKAAASNAGKYFFDGVSSLTGALGFFNISDVATANQVRLWAGSHVAGAITDDGNFHILATTINGVSSFIWQDGTQVATGNSSTSNLSGATIGNVGGGGSAGLTGDIAEVIIYGSALSASDRASVDYYLSTKYGLAISDTPLPYSSTGYKVDVKGKVSTSGESNGLTTVSFSTTPNFDASVANTFKLTLTGNVTSSILSNAVAGQPLNFIICQDSTGSRTFTWPANFSGTPTIQAAANACTVVAWAYDGTTAYLVPASGTVAKGTSALGTGAIASGACDATATAISAPGVNTSDVIAYAPNTDPTVITGYAPSASGSLYIWAYPTTNAVNFKVCNNTSGSITPSALTLNWRVAR